MNNSKITLLITLLKRKFKNAVKFRLFRFTFHILSHHAPLFYLFKCDLLLIQNDSGNGFAHLSDVKCLCRNVVKHLDVTHFCSANIVHLPPPSSSYGMPELHHNQFQERTQTRNWKVQLC